MTLVPHHINWPPQRETQLNMCFLTINPTDGYNLKERKKQDGHYSGVIVHQLENIDSHLNRNTVFRTAGMWDKGSHILVIIHPVNYILYLQDARNSKEESYNTNNKNKQLLPLENPHQTLIELIHETGHQHFNHRKLEKHKKQRSHRVALSCYMQLP